MAACGTSASDPAPDTPWTTFEVGEVTGVETRFRKQEPFEPTEAQRADLTGRCPRLARGRAVKESETFYLTNVELDGLDALSRVGALLPDGTLADAAHRVDDARTITLPVGCDRCTLIFGVRLEDGRVAACTGPGFSIGFADGTLTSP